MDRELTAVSVGSHRAGMERAKRRAIASISEEQFEAAVAAIMDAMKHKAALDELEFQADAWEVSHA